MSTINIQRLLGNAEDSLDTFLLNSERYTQEKRETVMEAVAEFINSFKTEAFETGKQLITTDSWFVAPDGKQYRAVWGKVRIVDDSILGIKTNRNSSNWFAIVGEEEKQVIIAGCQIHYSVGCPERPYTHEVEGVELKENGPVRYMRPSFIYIAE